MRQDLYRTIGVILASATALVGFAAGIHMLVSLPIPESKGAEWVAAIGTIGTLIGTIWLATAEIRRRKRDQKELAIIAGASVYHLVAHMRLVMKWVTDGSTAEGMTFNKEAFKLTADNLRNCEVWTNEEIIHLIAAGNCIATDLAIAKKRFQWCVTALDMAASTRTAMTPEACKGLMVPINNVLLPL